MLGPLVVAACISCHDPIQEGLFTITDNNLAPNPLRTASNSSSPEGSYQCHLLSPGQPSWPGKSRAVIAKRPGCQIARTPRLALKRPQDNSFQTANALPRIQYFVPDVHDLIEST